MSEELKPCPFCGSAPELLDGGSVTAIRCSSDQCISRPEPFNDWGHKESAIAAWNRRAQPEPQAFPPITEQQSQWGRLYTAANALVVQMGYHGSMQADSIEMESLKDKLHDIDGGEWMPGLMPPAQPEPAAPAGEFCWLVEMFEGDGSGNSAGLYHTGLVDIGGYSRTTRDVYQARRYSTREHAERVATELGTTLTGIWRAVEHGFASAQVAAPSVAPEPASDTEPVADRTLLEQFDLDQSPDYHKGRADGRALGYDVGFRHGLEQFKPPRPEPLTEDRVKELVKECGLDWQRGYMPLFDGDPTNRFAVLVEAVEAAIRGRGEG